MPGKKRKNKQKKPHQNTQSRYSRHHSASKHTQYITSRSKLLHAFQRSLVFRSLHRYLARKRFCIRKLSLLPMFRHWIRFFKDHLMLESSPKTGKVKTRMPKTVKYQIKKKKITVNVAYQVSAFNSLATRTRKITWNLHIQATFTIHDVSWAPGHSFYGLCQQNSLDCIILLSPA